jgi:predicted O-methyltransferase YrrM
MFCPLPPTELENVPGHLHPLEGRLLYWLASQVPAGGCVVEIGSYLGRSSGFLATGLKSNAKLVCVDTWLNDAMPIEKRDVMQQFLTNTRRLAARLEIARGRSEEIAARWVKPVDVLFIDGDHSYAGCSTDLKSWLPFVRSRGWIAVHDSAVIGVARAIRDFLPAKNRVGSPRRIWSILAIRKR